MKLRSEELLPALGQVSSVLEERKKHAIYTHIKTIGPQLDTYACKHTHYY
jgi:hypothetical protein